MHSLHVETTGLFHDTVVCSMFEQNEYLEQMWTLGVTCRTARAVLLPLSDQYTFIRKTGMTILHIHEKTLFWQCCHLSSDDILCATRILRDTFSKLIVLYANNNTICDRGVDAVVTASKGLRHLSLACNHVTDVGASRILKLETLHELNLRGNMLSVAMKASLRERHVPNNIFISV